MMRSLAIFAIALAALTLAAQPAGATPPSAACAVIAAKVAPARSAHDPAALATIWNEAQAVANGCDERAIHCIGQSLALGQLDLAYAASDAGRDGATVGEIARKGLAYGSPWELEAALGDIETALGQAGGDGASYSEAAWSYQQALIGVGEPQVCGDYGAPPPPNTAQLETLYNHFSAALLLADPLKVATTRCAPCEWLFLTGVAGFTPKVRPLPITFPTGSDQPMPMGQAAVDALLECLKATQTKAITLSGHTDPHGPTAANFALSKRRLGVVQRQLQAGGYAGSVTLDPRGERDPFEAAPGFSRAEQWQLDRRIDLRQTTPGEETSCD